MSKEVLSELNQSLLRHFKEKGIENAFYYEPLFDYYWLQKEKIGICNLEPYDNGSHENLMGLKKVDNEVIDYWYGSKTFQRTLKMFQLITKKLETGGYVTEKDLAECDNKNVDMVVEKDLGTSLYFNFRLTVGKHSKESTDEIVEFYNDSFYQEYFRNFVKATELNMLIVTGQTGCALMNKIYPDLHLEYNKEPKCLENLLICSAPHPAARSYSNKDLVDNINYFFDCYWEKA